MAFFNQHYSIRLFVRDLCWLIERINWIQWGQLFLVAQNKQICNGFAWANESIQKRNKQKSNMFCSFCSENVISKTFITQLVLTKSTAQTRYEDDQSKQRNYDFFFVSDLWKENRLNCLFTKDKHLLMKQNSSQYFLFSWIHSASSNG